MRNYRYLMHSICTYTSGYFSFYDDEYRRVHYDDDHHHASHDFQESADLQTSLQIANSTMMGPGGGVQIAWGSTLARVGCR